MDDDIFGEDYFPMDPDEDLVEPMNLDELVEQELADDTPVSAKDPPVVELAEPKGLEKEDVVFESKLEDVVLSEPPDTNGGVFYSVASAHPDRPRMYLRERLVDNQGQASAEGVCSHKFLEKPIEELHAMALAQTAKRDAELTEWLSAMSSSAHGDSRQYADKYKPERFVDLLSDDSVNRQTMSWFCEWKKNLRESCVSGSFTISEPINPVVSSTESAAQNRKVLLISGPPGVGKSALIDVCARHCSFSIVESNSSEERGRAAMSKLVSDVCGNRSVLDASKPQLLLIEEVDGEECCAPEVLVDILHKHPEAIKRPIICVCTDAYQKNLKPLREISTLIVLGQPKGLRLCEKLKQISKDEGIQIESLALDRLVNLCESDIRSCLNQLQALASRACAKESVIRVEDVSRYVGNEGRSLEAAVKDNQRSEMELLQLIFEPKRSRASNHASEIARAISQAKSLPIEDLFAHCCVTVPFTDVSLKHTCALFQLLSMGEKTLALRYASHHCAAVAKPRIDIANARKLISTRFARRAERESVNAALIKSSSHAVAASGFIMRSRASWTLYGSRFLLVALSPEHNPVWVKKTARGVHPEIERIAKLYAEFGIEMVEHHVGGDENPLKSAVSTHQNTYILNPNLRVLSDIDESNSPALSYLVGSPLGELLKTQTKFQLTKALSLQDGSVELISRGKRSIAPSLANDLDDLSKKQRPSALSLSAWASKVGAPSSAASKSLVVKRFPFEFRFNEGHTNAVKRVMHLKDFLPQRHE